MSQFRNGNGYLILFTVVLTVVCAFALAGASVGLKAKTEAAQALDKKTKILGATMDVSSMSPEEIEETYNSKVEAVYLDILGNEIDPSTISEIENSTDKNKLNVEAQYKDFMKGGSVPQYYPLYKVKSKVFDNGYDAFIIPVYGNGLWDNIWGYVALGSDFSTIKGAVFDHKAETPGLGARITDASIQSRFVDKQIFDEAGVLQGVYMMNGEGNDYSTNPHAVDGMAGATSTANGLNAMLNDYFTAYSAYFVKQRASLED